MSFASGIIFVAGFIVLGTFEVTLILAAHNHEYAVAQFVNFFGDNNELPILFGMFLLRPDDRLGHPAQPGAAPLPKRSAGTPSWSLCWRAGPLASSPFCSASRSGSSPPGS